MYMSNPIDHSFCRRAWLTDLQPVKAAITLYSMYQRHQPRTYRIDLLRQKKKQNSYTKMKASNIDNISLNWVEQALPINMYYMFSCMDIHHEINRGSMHRPSFNDWKFIYHFWKLIEWYGKLI